MEIKTLFPPYWFTGMTDSRLQLLIGHQHGYAFLDTDLRGCKPGKIILTAEIEGERVSFPYELRERRKRDKAQRSINTEDVVYLIMPDRFARDDENANATPSSARKKNAKNSYHGGNINGIRKHLDYLSDLGVTSLWLTPVMKGSEYHGYAITNHYDIDPHFGTMQDYCDLVSEAHERGLKIIMDCVFNHCGHKHPWMALPPDAEWINHPDGSLLTNYRLTPVVDPYAADIDRQQTVEGWFVKTMPDLNLRNPRLLKYFTQCTFWWIETAGIDGIRMDTYPYADASAMEQWLQTLHKEYPGFYVVGETWVCHSAFTAKMQQGELDSSMDFALFEAFNYAKHEESNEWWSGLNRIYNVLCYDYLYRNPAMTMAFLDNHDVNRFPANDLSAKMIARTKAALAILLTIPRIPQIYYGTEILMTGTTEGGDDNVRKDFPGGMPGAERNAFTRQGRTREENDMHRFMRNILQWRRKNAAIAHGTTKQFMPYNGIYVIARSTESETVLTIVNGNSRRVTFHPERYAEVLRPTVSGAFVNGKDIISGRTIHLDKPFTLAPHRSIICQILRDRY